VGPALGDLSDFTDILVVGSALLVFLDFAEVVVVLGSAALVFSNFAEVVVVGSAARVFSQVLVVAGTC
jgi:hypothetical protein